tara:strand:- start:288 stop:665 length:378 start_codon:yes stop_codon:yes gene_type:complete
MVAFQVLLYGLAVALNTTAVQLNATASQQDAAPVQFVSYTEKRNNTANRIADAALLWARTQKQHVYECRWYVSIWGCNWSPETQKSLDVWGWLTTSVLIISLVVNIALLVYYVKNRQYVVVSFSG